jgi:hypothetical protein
MPGRTKQLIDELIELRAGPNQGLSHFLRAHLLMKGIDPDAFDENTPDDPEKVATLQKMIAEFKAKG